VQSKEKTITEDETERLLKKSVPKWFSAKNVKDIVTSKTVSNTRKQDILYNYKLIHTYLDQMKKVMESKNG